MTVAHGTNRLVDPGDGAAICVAARVVAASGKQTRARRPELWDGRASERIGAALAEWAVRLAAGNAAASSNKGA